MQVLPDHLEQGGPPAQYLLQPWVGQENVVVSSRVSVSNLYKILSV